MNSVRVYFHSIWVSAMDVVSVVYSKRIFWRCGKITVKCQTIHEKYYSVLLLLSPCVCVCVVGAGIAVPSTAAKPREHGRSASQHTADHVAKQKTWERWMIMCWEWMDGPGSAVDVLSVHKIRIIISSHRHCHHHHRWRFWFFFLVSIFSFGLLVCFII